MPRDSEYLAMLELEPKDQPADLHVGRTFLQPAPQRQPRKKPMTILQIIIAVAAAGCALLIALALWAAHGDFHDPHY